MERINLFNAGMTDLRELYDGERLYQVSVTSFENDGLCFFAGDDEVKDEGFEGRIVDALARKYGRKRARSMYMGYEDVTDYYYGEDEDE